jgi:hypothetical protein
MNQIGSLSGSDEKRRTALRRYGRFGLMMSLLFALVGALFLFFPDGVTGFFNGISRCCGLPPAPVQERSLFLVLAVGYMYLVTGLAWLIFRHPGHRWFTLLLIQGKALSSLLSICLFFFHRPYLVYLVNGVVDGLIALLFLFFYFRIVRGMDEPVV